MAFYEYTAEANINLGGHIRMPMPTDDHIPGLFFAHQRPIFGHLEVGVFQSIPHAEFVIRNPQDNLEWELSPHAQQSMVVSFTHEGNECHFVGTPGDTTNAYQFDPPNGAELMAWAAPVRTGDMVQIRIALMEYHLEIDWSDSGLYDHAMADVTGDVVSYINTMRGRDYGSMIYGRSVAGRMNFELTNHEGKYERFNPASPLIGMVVPQRRVRLWIEGAARKAHLDIWTGRVDRFEPKERRGGADVTSVVAYGVMTRLTQRTVSVPYQTNITTGDGMEDILQNAGLTSKEIGDMDGARMMARFWSRPQPAIAAARQVEETEGGFLHETADGSLRFEDSTYRVRGARMQPAARLTDSRTPGGDIPITYVYRDDPVKDIANIVQVPVYQFSTSTSRVLWELESPVVFTSNETKVFIVEFPNRRSPVDIVSIVSFDTPATGTDFRLTQNPDGSGNLRAGTITAEQTGDGLVLTVTTGAAGAWLTTLRVRGTYLELEDPIVIQLSDSDSIDEFGPRTYPVPAQFISEIRDAESYGSFLLDITKDTQSKIRAGFNINGHIDTSLALELSSRVALTTRETGGDMYIEAIEHNINLRARRHDMALTLFPAIAFFSDVIALDIGPGLDTGVLGR